MKRIVFIILLMFPFIVLAYPQGDVDGNNVVGATDYVLVRKHLLKQSLLTGDSLKRADVNKDGKVSAIDYVEIKRIILRGPSSSNPTSTPKPTATPTPRPTATPKPTATPTPKPVVYYNVSFAGSDIVTTGFERRELLITGGQVSTYTSKNNNANKNYNLNLTTNQKYAVSFDYWTTSGNNEFDADLFPDTLPQIMPVATTTKQHYDWILSSTDSKMSEAALRFFDDRRDADKDEHDIKITNVLMSKVTDKVYQGGKPLGTLPTPPARYGYDFIGWFNSNGAQVTANTIVNGNMLLYARWRNKYDGLSARIHFIRQPSNDNNTDLKAGDAILLESNGHFAMVDTGLYDKADNDYVLNYLRKVGVTKLDFVIITHMHRDHTGSLLAIVKNIPVSKIWMKKDPVTGDSKSTEIMKEVKKIKKNDFKYPSKDGENLYFQNMKIEFYNVPKAKSGGANGDSLMQYITIGNYKIFLTGDLYNDSGSVQYLKTLTKKAKFQNLDLLKMPHHGYSQCALNNKETYTRLNPKYIIITRGGCASDICDKIGATNNLYYTKVADTAVSGTVFNFGSSITVEYTK